MSKRFYDMVETCQGWIGVVASEQGIRRNTLPCQTPDECAIELGVELIGAVQTPGRFNDLHHRLKTYFNGEDVAFTDLVLDVDDATAFYRRCWEACRSIPRGETRTYRWLACEAGAPNAPRAAGQTMARNRMPIIVPCHRVIGSDGSLRGFGSGTERLDLKRLLLEMESGTRRLF